MTERFRFLHIHNQRLYSTPSHLSVLHSAILLPWFIILLFCISVDIFSKQQTEHSLKPPHAGVLNGLKLSLQSSINTELKALNFRAQQANEKPSLLWACSASQPQQRASKSTALNEKQPPTFGHQWKEKKKGHKNLKVGVTRSNMVTASCLTQHQCNNYVRRWP